MCVWHEVLFQLELFNYTSTLIQIQSNFFQVGVCGQDFQSVDLQTDFCLELLLKRGVLWTEIFKFGGLRAKIRAKIEAAEAKISNCFSKGVLWTDFLALLLKIMEMAWMGPLRTMEEAWKGFLPGGFFRAAHPHTPFLGRWATPSPRSNKQNWVITKNGTPILITNKYSPFPSRLSIPSTGVQICLSLQESM